MSWRPQAPPGRAAGKAEEGGRNKGWQSAAETHITRLREESRYAEPVFREQRLQRPVAWEPVHPPAMVAPRQFDYAAEDAFLAEWEGTKPAAFAG